MEKEEKTIIEIEKEIVAHVEKNLPDYINPKQDIKRILKSPYLRYEYKRMIRREIKKWSDEKKREFYKNMEIAKRRNETKSKDK